jgi:hypothetical protein
MKIWQKKQTEEQHQPDVMFGASQGLFLPLPKKMASTRSGR